MDWGELYKQIVRNLDYWGSYISMRTSLEKEDVVQDLLIIIWETYCDKKKRRKDITKGYAQYRLNYAASRILKSFFSNNETRLNKVPIEEELLYEDLPYFLRPAFIRDKIKSTIKEEYINSSKRGKYMKVLDLLLEGRNRKETAKEIGCSIGSVSVIVNEKIMPILRKVLNI
ncbi:hypothetical protein LCGC14_1118110, partial [marine sediment metagenome]